MSERWADVPGYDRVRVSDGGKVLRYGRRGWSPAAECVTPSGHLTTSVKRGGKWRTASVHRLVLLAFVGPPEPGQMTCHANGDPADNRLANLRWGTAEDNWSDKRAHGTATIGEMSGMSKLTGSEVLAMREAVAGGESVAHVAARLGVTAGNVQFIASGATWRHLGGARTPAGPKGRKGEAHPHAKLTADCVRTIRKDAACGRRAVAIAAAYGVSDATIRDCVSGRTWGHVQ